MKNKKGFTLLELLVVVLIIGVLTGIALPQYKMAVLKANYARAKQTASDIRKAYELYYLTYNEFPTKFSQLDFANKFDDASSINTGKYSCKFNVAYHELACYATNRLLYFVNFYTYSTKDITISCRALSTNKSDIYNKFCQKETGKTAAQAFCSDSANYCGYIY